MGTISGRCYCGQVVLSADAPPLVVAYCHCEDCRRWTGAPLPAFAAFDAQALSLTPPVAEQEHSPGVFRRHCIQCGSPLSARFAYLPGQIYVPVGVLDDAKTVTPSLHCHADKALPWLHISDDLPRQHGSARDTLNARS